MRATVAILALAFLVAGCTKKQMQDEVRSQLKDPNSAEFTQVDLKTSQGGSRYILCGMVNAKNSYGGYVGARPFTATREKDSDKVTVDLGDSASCMDAVRSAEANEALEQLEKKFKDKNA